MLTPDRKPDIVKVNPVADEVPLANVIRFERTGRTWRARIGPVGQTIEAEGGTWHGAVRRLVARCERLNWPIDEGWVDRL